MQLPMPSRLAPRIRPDRPFSTLTGAAVPSWLTARPYPRVRVFIAPGATGTNTSVWSWIEVTHSVRGDDSLTIKRGRSDTSIQAEPARITFVVNNPNGDWTPFFPTGQWYPNMALNLPVRVHVDYGAGDVLRGTCRVDSLTPGWDKTLRAPTVAVTASGLLKRYNQGSRPAQCLLEIWNFSTPPPVAYWTLQDPNGSDSFHELVGNQPAMLWNETEPTFASSGPPASSPVVKLASATELHADLVPYTNAGKWSVQWICYIPTAPSVSTPIVTLECYGTLVEWRVYVVPSGGTDTLLVEAYTATSGTPVISTSTNFAVTGASEPYAKWLSFSLTATQNGTGVDYALYMAEMTTAQQTSLSGSIVTQTLGNPSRIGVHNGWSHTDWLYGHIALYNFLTSYPQDILDGYTNQTAGERMDLAILYAGEADSGNVGLSSDQQYMGPWGVLTFIDQLKECEAADSGAILYDGKNPNIIFRTRKSRYNLTAGLTVDMSQGQIAAPFTPVLDDQRLRNEWTVSRTGGNSGTGGSSATVKDTVDQAIHGRYADTVSLNLYDDTLLKHHAGWKLNLGTYAGARITRLTLELHRSTSLAAAWAALDIGDRIDLTNLPSNYPPGAEELVLEGYTETIKNFLWTVEANCSPYKPWDVLTIASAFTSRIQTGGSSLAADISATDLSMSVASPVAANLFTTTATFPSDFPLYVYVGGEAIAVTAIVGTTSPQTFTITRSDNGVVKAHRAGDAVTLKFAYPIAL